MFVFLIYKKSEVSQRPTRIKRRYSILLRTNCPYRHELNRFPVRSNSGAAALLNPKD